MESLIFNSYVGGACIFEYHDGKTELLRFNAEYAELFGRHFDHADIDAHRNMLSVLDDKNAAVLRKCLDTAIATKKEASCEFELRDRNNENAMYVRTALRQIAEAGDRHLFYCVVHDYTEQRIAEAKQLESARQLEVIMDNVNGGVSAIQIRDDGTSTFVFNNDRYYELYGYTTEQARAEHLDVMTLILPEDMPDVMAKVKQLKWDRQPITIDYRIQKPDGSRALLRVNASLMDIPGYGDDVITSVIVDITEKKSLEDQLRFLNDSASNILAATDDETAIHDTLRGLMGYFAADRGYVVELDYERGVTNNTYEVCVDGIDAEIGSLQDLPFSPSDFWYDTLSRREFLIIEDVAAMDEGQAELREMLLDQGISSIVLAPLWGKDRMIGFVGVDNPKQALDQIPQLTGLADYISFSLSRRDLNRKIEGHIAEQTAENARSLVRRPERSGDAL